MSWAGVRPVRRRQDHTDKKPCRRRGVDDFGAGQIQNAAKRGAHHLGNLVDRRMPGDGVRETLEGHQIWHKGTDRRLMERPARAFEQEDGEDRPHRLDPRHRVEIQQDGADQDNAIGHNQHDAAVEQIRDIACHKRESDRGGEGRKADISEVHDVALPVVDLVGDGDHHHVKRHPAEGLPDDQETEIALTQG